MERHHRGRACTDKIDTQGHPPDSPLPKRVAPVRSPPRREPGIARPLKPDVVLEGGNAAKDDRGASWMTSPSLLTTHNQPLERLFTTSNATSAASALLWGMAARIMAAYPHLRPETVRALLVHSAQWSESMRDVLPAVPNKDHYVNLIRHCGWGARPGPRAGARAIP